jgi:hypothetical protein
VDHAAAKHGSAAGKRSECRDAMDPSVVFSDVDGAALPPRDRTCALARAVLRLAVAGLGVGARAPILWAALPLLAIGVVEKIEGMDEATHVWVSLGSAIGCGLVLRTPPMFQS